MKRVTLRQTKILSVTYKIALNKVGATAEHRTCNFSVYLDLWLSSRSYMNLNVLNQLTMRVIFFPNGRNVWTDNFNLRRSIFVSQVFDLRKFTLIFKYFDSFIKFLMECTKYAKSSNYLNERMRPCYCAYVSISRVSSYPAALAWQRRRQFGPDSGLLWERGKDTILSRVLF